MIYFAVILLIAGSFREDFHAFNIGNASFHLYIFLHLPISDPGDILCKTIKKVEVPNWEMDL